MAKKDEKKAKSPTGAMRLENVPLDQLHDHPENDYSMDSADLEEMMESIRREGLAQPPLVRPYEDGYQIVSGHRRVECFRRLAAEDPDAYGTIPVNVLEDCSDERALVLLDVTNLMVRQLSVAERAKRYERLWQTVPQLREKHPELRGVRTSQVISDVIARETGQTVSRATIDRALAAGKRAQTVKDLVEERRGELIEQWASELTSREGFTPVVVHELANRDAAVQDRLWSDYQRDGLTPKQLEKLLVYENPKTDADIERALDGVIATLRDVSAWHKKYGAAIDMYRVDYIKGQLQKLTRK